MHCYHCGAENRNDRRFCTECGAKLKSYTNPDQVITNSEDVKDEKPTKKRVFNKIIVICEIVLFIIAAVFAVLAIVLTKFKFAFLITAASCFGVILLLALVDAIVNAIVNKKNN